MTDALIAARLVHFAAVMMLFGGSLFPVYAGAGEVAGLSRFLRVALVVSALLALASELAWLATAIANMTGDWTDIGDPEVVRSALLETEFGQVWIVRMGLTAMLLVLAFFRFSTGTRGGRELFVSLSGFLLAMLALTGHAAAHKGWVGDVHRVNQAIHLLAGGAWLGGLVPLGRVLAQARRTGSAAAIGWAGTVVRRFSAMGYWAVGLILLTGTVNSIFLVGSFGALTGSQYGHVLIDKIVLVMLMVALAAANRVLLVPKLAVGTDPRPTNALFRNVMIELVLGLGVLAVVSMLGTLIPALYHEA